MTTRTKWINTPWTYDKLSALDTSQATLMTLVDIREQLRRVVNLLDCHNTRDIPAILRRVARNTAKPRKKSKPKKGSTR